MWISDPDQHISEVSDPLPRTETMSEIIANLFGMRLRDCLVQAGAGEGGRWAAGRGRAERPGRKWLTKQQD